MAIESTTVGAAAPKTESLGADAAPESARVLTQLALALLLRCAASDPDLSAGLDPEAASALRAAGEVQLAADRREAAALSAALARAEAAEAAVADLERKLAASEATVATLENRLTASDAEATALRAELADAESADTAMAADLAALADGVAALGAAVANRRARRAALFATASQSAQSQPDDTARTATPVTRAAQEAAPACGVAAA